MTTARPPLHASTGFLLAGLALLAAGDAAGSPPAPGTLVDEPCDIELAEPALADRLRCARLHVLRDPDQPAQGRFEIAVVIRRSAAPKPGAAPVLFLHGGPGGEMTRWVGTGSRDPAPGHDLVAFDQRGSGRTTPRVCDGAGAALMQAFVDVDGPQAAAAHRQSVAEACLREWRAAGFAGTHFGTARTVGDAEALREALGVERWLLLGESYGTTVAAHYVATHPERIVAAVLDSLYPPDDGVLPVAEMQARLVDRIGADCAADADCAARFPGFGRAALAAAVANFDRQPLRVGGRPVDGMPLRQLVALAASDEAGARAIPLLLDAARRGDPRYFEGMLAASASGGYGAANLAALMAIDCRDRARHHAAGPGDDTLRLLAGLPSGSCAAWTAPGEAPRWPWGSSVPMLLLAGGYDSFQPDAAAIAARIGPAAQVVEVAVASHGVRGAGPCVRELVGAWLADPTRAPDTTCIRGMVAPPFLLDVIPVAGVAPLAVAGLSSPWALALAGSSVLALLAGLCIPLWRRLRRAAPGRSIAGVSAGLAVLLLVLALGLPLAAMVGADASQEAVGRFGLAAPAGHALWLAWPATALALMAAVAALRARERTPAAAAAAVLVAVGSAAALRLLPLT